MAAFQRITVPSSLAPPKMAPSSRPISFESDRIVRGTYTRAVGQSRQRRGYHGSQCELGAPCDLQRPCLSELNAGEYCKHTRVSFFVVFSQP
jgi:hypothetical protein